MLFGCISASHSVFVTWKNCWHSAGSSSPMKRCDNGASHLGRPTPTNYVVAALVAATNGTWMRVYREHQRENTLSLESSGSRWQRAGYPCTEPTEQTRGETFFSEAPQRVAICPTRDHHR